MSGRKKPPPSTALVRRARPDLSDAEIVALIVQRNHLFGRKRLHAAFDPEGTPVTLKLLNEEDFDPGASYLIYSEEIQQFVGLARKGAFFMEEPGKGRRARLVFLPAAQA